MNSRRKLLLMILITGFMILLFGMNKEVFAEESTTVNQYDISAAGDNSCRAAVLKTYELAYAEINGQPVCVSSVLKKLTLVLSGSGKMKDDPFSAFKTESISSNGTSSGYTLMSYGNLEIKISYDDANKVTNIGSKAFKDFTNLKTISLPNTITSIGNSAFENCTSLESFTIPDSVTEIGGNAFYGCTNLKTISINETSNLQKMYNTAIDNCSSLESLYLPSKLSSLPSYNHAPMAFSGLSSLTEIKVAENNANYSSESGVLFNKDKTTILKYPINRIVGYWAGPYWNTYVPYTYTIPDTVKLIGYGAFAGTSNLKQVIIPNSVTSMNPSAFSNTGLTSIELPESISTIGITAFAGCENLNYVRIPKTISSIDIYAFKNCKNLKKIIIPETVTNIHSSNPFEECEDLVIYCKEGSTAEQYAKDNNIKYIDYSENSDYEYIINQDGTVTITGYKGNDEEIDIPSEIEGKTITKIGEKAFFNNKNVKKITMPNGITSIEDYAFANTTITTINIPSTVNDIGKGAFYGCTLLTSNIVIPEGVKTIKDETFNGCLKISCVSIPNTVTYIGKDAFNSCMQIKNLTIPDGVVAIGDKAFWQCFNLEKITIPESVVSFGDSVFGRTSNLTIECYKGSKAEEFAKNNNITYELISNSEEDTTPPEVTVSYSTENQTTDPVTVTLTANEELQELSGWTLSTDKKKLTKSFSKNVEQVVKVKDLAGNETEVTIKIANITETEDPDPDDPSKNNTTDNNTTDNNTTDNNKTDNNKIDNNTTGNNTTRNNTTGSGTTGNNRITATNQTSKNAALNTVDSKSSSILPKTGLGKVSFIVAIIGIISSISFYVKYKKMY